MLFRQLFDAKSCSYTYLLAEPSGRGVLIDPVLEQVERDITLIEELGLELTHTIETHVHADHITASGILRNRMGSQSVMSRQAGVGCADILVDDGDIVEVGHLRLEVRHTPGHTTESICVVTSDRSMVFTGDTLFIRGCGRTDFQAGDPKQLYRSVHQKVFSLPDACLVYPGHDYNGHTVSTVGEEKFHNPRLGAGKSEAEFVAIMNGLDLPKPKLIDQAVPANEQCGVERPQVERTAHGVPEVSIDWVKRNQDTVRLVDVRSEAEFFGELGHIEGSALIELDRLKTAVSDWNRHQMIVIVCRSGRRSGQAAQTLESMGFKNVASMAGGMLAWRPPSSGVA
ncbi:MAG: MBL fold metallo-hydrolase [Myxococcota bacterium]